jgi:hypothetical protein
MMTGNVVFLVTERILKRQGCQAGMVAEQRRQLSNRIATPASRKQAHADLKSRLAGFVL